MCLQEFPIKTSLGCISVSVYGDQDKPALITYPDLALNRKYVENKEINWFSNVEKFQDPYPCSFVIFVFYNNTFI